nr:MAG: hypothetical protein [Wenzhou bat nodavirus 1]
MESGTTFSRVYTISPQYLTVDTTGAGQLLARVSRVVDLTFTDSPRHATAVVDVTVRFVVSRPAVPLTLSLAASETQASCGFFPATNVKLPVGPLNVNPLSTQATAQEPGEFAVSFAAVLPVEIGTASYGFSVDIESFSIMPKDTSCNIFSEVSYVAVLYS